jgi:hypothetical protein
MTAALNDLTIEAGAFFQFNAVVQAQNRAPVSLSGYGARMQIRQRVADVTPAVSLTMGSGIALGPDPGSFIITLDGDQTSAIGAAMQKGVYDLWLDPDGVKSPNSLRVMEGDVHVIVPVTR